MKPTGLCHTDMHYLEAKITHRFPVILGHMGGKVVALGPDVEDFAIGDRVVGMSASGGRLTPASISAT